MSEALSNVADVDITTRARAVDPAGWEELVARFQPLVNSVISRYRLAMTDAADVSQTVWLRLLDHIGRIRDPLALPGWIATTTARACLDVIAFQRRTLPHDPHANWHSNASGRAESSTEPQPDEALIRAESHAAVQRGLAELAPHQRELLLLVVADPPMSYEQISRRLGVPIGSIGPTRARCLKKLQRSSALSQLFNDARQAVDPSAAGMGAG